MENQNHPKQREKTETSRTPPPPPEGQAAAMIAVESPPPLPPPPSLSSSPSHEFSFSISFHTPNSLSTTAGVTSVDPSKPSPHPLDFDLAPADDIFFHGHLLPLQFIPHRLSDVSIHNAAFLHFNHNEIDETIHAATTAAVCTADVDEECNDGRNQKPFSLRWLQKWLRRSDGEDHGDEEKQRRRKRKKKRVLDVLRVWKNYTSLVEPFLLLKDWREKRKISRRSAHSFSGNSLPQRLRGGFSAPASRRTSPANSGLLVVASSNFSSEVSTMEELQNAIQSAITHCKNSGGCH